MKKQISLLFLLILFVSCEGNRPEKECKTFDELPDPNPDSVSWQSPLNNGLMASFVSIDNKYPKSTMPNLSQSRRTEKVEGWKGERVSSQILLWSPIDISQVEFEFSDFLSDKATLSSDIAQARFVRYVMTDAFANGCGHRKPEDFPSSLAPDMLDNLECFNMEAKTTLPVWITIDIPRDALAGVYKGSIQLFAKNQEMQNFDLEIEVINKTLAQASEWTIHMDQWQHPSAVARVHNLQVWSDAHFEKMRPLMKMAADLGQKVITANVNKDPWHHQCYDAYEDMIIWTKQKDGSWKYDYTIFDKWVEFMMDLGVNKMINCYSMIPWNNEIHYMDEASGKLINVKADPGTTIFVDMWAPFLKDFTQHLKEKGWLEITNIAMDERDPKEMSATLDVLQKYGSKLGIAFADNQKSYKKYPFIKDMCVGAEAQVDLADIQDRRTKGLITTYYVCCSHEFPNIFTFSDAAEATYLFWYAIAADYDGFLRWAFNSWVEDPIRDSRFRTWPAGDTYLVYPDARSSIRYERMLEGVQDFEKIRVVRKLLEEKEEKEKLEELNSAIFKLKTTERTSHWNKDLNDAKSLLNKITRDI